MGEKKDRKDLISKGEVDKLMADSIMRQHTGIGLYDQPLDEEQRRELKEWKEFLEYDQLLQERNSLILEKKTLQKQNKRLRKTQAKFNHGYRGTITKILNNFLDLFFVVVSLWIGFILGNVKSLGYKAVLSKGTIVFAVATAALAFLIALLSYMRANSDGTVKVRGERN